MGIENMRRWPMYILFTVCVLLTLSLLNSWSFETELQLKISELNTQLQECSRHQAACMEDSLKYQEQRDQYNTKLSDLVSQKTKIEYDLSDYKNKALKFEKQANSTLVDADICKAELQSLTNLQVSKTAMLDTLRLEKETLNTQLVERKLKIDELEKEILKLKSALTTKSGSSNVLTSKVTPAAQPPKISPALNINNPINEPVLEDNAKEDIEDPSVMNNNDFEQK